MVFLSFFLSFTTTKQCHVTVLLDLCFLRGLKTGTHVHDYVLWAIRLYFVIVSQFVNVPTFIYNIITI